MSAQRPAAVFLVLLTACLTAPTRADEDDAQQRKLLSGTWQGYAVAGKGENPDTGPVKLELVITEKSIHGVSFQNDERVDQGEGEYTLNLSAAPRTLDGAKLRLNGRKDEWLGIYTLEGDTLKWCVGRRERPTTFETVKGQFLLILKREKPE
jgi:uncharacterized protein (TIGR03067 family)